MNLGAWMNRRLSQFLGRPLVYDLASYLPHLAAINELKPEFVSLSDTQLGERSEVLKRRVLDGTQLNTVVPQTFALVRESARRVLGQWPFDVQILAGLAMQRGNIAELSTGEGKTLAAVAP